MGLKKNFKKQLTVPVESDIFRAHTVTKQHTSHMRTKTLVLTAAISAAALATSMAQVVSVNAVGYVRVTVAAGNLQLLANPLNQTNNDLNFILQLNGDGSQ